MNEGCPVKRSCEQFGAGYVIARAKDEADATVGLHIYVENRDDAAELDVLLVRWEAAREERLAAS